MEWGVVLRYVLVLGVLTGIGAPLAAWAFDRFPRKGATFALPAALLPVTLIIVWIGQIAFGRWTVLLAIAIVGIGSATVYRRGARPDWRGVVTGFGVFLIGFGFLLFVRGTNPAITPAGGEQFLHFGLTRAIERAGQLPPEDMWFAGKPVRYYYGGQLQVSSLSMLAGADLRYGFNLGIATFYGILFAAAYGLVGAVTARAGSSRTLGGTLGVILVAWGGATTTAIRLIVARLPEDLGLALAGPPFGFAASRFGIPLSEFITEQGGLESWSWWYTRYVVPGTLQEFPLYSFVKADLHGHALANGYILVAAALAFAYYRTPSNERWRRRTLLFGGIGLVAGVFGVMNTWSLPTAVGLSWLAVATANAHPASVYPAGVASQLHDLAAESQGRLSWAIQQGWRIVLALPPAVGVGIVGVILAAPFLAFGDVPRNGGIGFLPPTSPLLPFLVIYGGLLAGIVGVVAWHGWPALRQTAERRRALVLLGVVALPLLVVAPVLAILGPVILLLWWLVRADRVGFAGVLMIGGLGLLASMEVVHAVVWPPELDRWNTSLKVAVQGWTVGAAGVAAGITMLLDQGRKRLRERQSGAGVQLSTLVVIGLCLLVVVTALPFPFLVSAETIGEQLRRGESFSINGIEPLERWHGEELAAIQWLDRHDGRPTIVERPGWETYRWTNPASTLTGLPTVAGWAHERGYRGIDVYERRAASAEAVYVGDWKRATDVLREFDVRFVYVGPNEREAYSGLTERFAGRPGVSIAFENDAVTIYRIDPSLLESS
ncbi:MAG: DUF2298 domain-containing protein [Salinirussus sp.]